MNTISKTSHVRSVMLTFVSGLLLPMIAAAAPANSPNATGMLEDRPLPAFQRHLLELAFDTATAIPVVPHLKDRSRAQYAVLLTCLELGQNATARDFAERIGDWRRGAAYVDLAYHCFREGKREAIDELLSRATDVADVNEDWRRDRIRVKIAQIHALMGDAAAVDVERDVVDAEIGKVAEAVTAVCDPATFDEQLANLDELLKKKSFDVTRNVLRALSKLHERFYADSEKRRLLEARIERSWDRMPVFIRLETLSELTTTAIAANDLTNALRLVEEAQTLLDGSRWRPEHRILRVCRLASLRHRAGEPRQARAQIDAMFDFYTAETDKIVDIYRAGALRAIAGAYASMGETRRAVDIYKLAVEAGMANPNSRPRAEDLSATCRSLAENNLEPDAELWQRMRAIRAQLGNPW